MNDELYDTLISINIRHSALKMQGLGFELYDLFDEHLKTKNNKYGKLVGELYYSRIDKKLNSHIYDSNEWLYMINKKFFNYLNRVSLEQQKNVYNHIKIDYKIIIAQTNSLISRPFNLKKPSEYTNNEVKKIEETSDGFLRIGYYEKELYRKDRYKEDYKTIKMYGGVVFGKKGILNFFNSFNKLDIKGVYNNELSLYEQSNIGDHLMISYIKHLDMLENFRILWVSNELLEKLELKMGSFTKGLFAINNKGETIIKYNQWNSHYMGNEINNQIPRLSGSELLIRKDYFEKIKSIYNEKEFYSINII